MSLRGKTRRGSSRSSGVGGAKPLGLGVRDGCAIVGLSFSPIVDVNKLRQETIGTMAHKKKNFKIKKKRKMWKGKIEPWLTRKKNEQSRVARCPQVLRYLPLSSSGVKLNLHQDAFVRKTKIFIPSGRPEACHLMDETAQNSNIRRS